MTANWNLLRDTVHALQVERGAWRCPKWKLGTEREVVCPTCNGTGKYRDVAEVVCDIHGDLTDAWRVKRQYDDLDNGYNRHSLRSHLATAALRTLDLAGHYEGNDESEASDDSVAAMFAHLHRYAGEQLLHLAMYDFERLAIKLGIDFEAAIQAKLAYIQNGGAL